MLSISETARRLFDRAAPPETTIPRETARPAVSRLESKIIQIGGFAIDVAGLPTDRYFEHVENVYSDNIALCNLIWTTIAPGAVIMDVGANIGIFSTLFNRIIPDTTVYSFEPSPKAYECLTETLRRNGVRTDRAFNFGIGEKSGTLNFYECDMLAGSCIVTQDDNKHLANTTIPVVPIDQFVKEQKLERLDFIKIDVEGFESEVLKGAKQTLARFKPRVFIEFNSYSLICIRDVNPRRFLDQILDTFSCVMWWDGSAWRRINNFDDRQHFMHENLTKHSCVGDVLCSYQ